MRGQREPGNEATRGGDLHQVCRTLTWLVVAGGHNSVSHAALELQLAIKARFDLLVTALYVQPLIKILFNSADFSLITSLGTME